MFEFGSGSVRKVREHVRVRLKKATVVFIISETTVKNLSNDYSADPIVWHNRFNKLYIM